MEPRRLLSTTRFAVIGDFGSNTPTEAGVAAMVAGWDAPAAGGPLDAVITLGDNNYFTGEWGSIDTNIGQYYSRFIGNYQGTYGPGAPVNRFFPSMGNHDWDSSVDHDGDGVVGADPYLDYFTLPASAAGGERYYDFTKGPVHFFALDSDPREPDGRTATSPQAQWLREGLAASTSPWNIVYFHHPPFSSSLHGSDPQTQWPFREWGADLVLSGHDHAYERLESDGLTYIVNGLGGQTIYGFFPPVPQSRFKFNTDVGAQLIDATDTTLTASFYSAGVLDTAGLIDQFTLRNDMTAPRPLTATFRQGANGYAGTVDTAVVAASPDTPFGTATTVSADANRPTETNHDKQPLLRFDNLFGTAAGQVPAGAQIASATLELNVTDGGDPVALHRMLRSWSASDTWNTLGAGIQANGTDAAAATDASIIAPAADVFQVDVTASVRAWAAAPASNRGWALLASTGDGITLSTAESATPPKLTINYYSPGGPPVPVADQKTTTEDAALSFPAADLLANDTAPAGGPLTVTAVAPTADTHGTVALAGGTITFTPAPDFFGPAKFLYTVTDSGGVTADGMVNVAVPAVNDAPTFPVVPDRSEPAGDGPRTLPLGTVRPGPDNEIGQRLTFTVTSSNPDVVSAPAVSYDPSTGAAVLTYTVPEGAAGVAAVTVTARDDAGADSPARTFNLTVGGIPAVKSVAINDGSAQRSMVRTVAVTFSQPVVLDDGAFTLAGRGGAAAGTAVVVTGPSADGNTWTLTFAGPGQAAGGSLPDGIYDLRVVAGKVHAAGVAMAGDFTTAFHRLYSDADGDGDSDNFDLLQLRPTLLKPSTDPAYKAFFDFDGSGVVDNLDVFQVRSRRGIVFRGY